MRSSRCAAAHQRNRSSDNRSSAPAAPRPLPLPLLVAVFVLAFATPPADAASVEIASAPLTCSNMTSPMQRHARGRHHKLVSSPRVPDNVATAHDQSPLLVWDSHPMPSHLPLHVHPLDASQLTSRELRMRLRMEGEHHNSSTSSCCPSVLEMVEPDAGKNQDGVLVQLYRDGRYRQRFYELSCHRDVLDKPCRFVDKRLTGRTRCVQQHGWTYALVKDSPERRHRHFLSFPAGGSAGATYTLDYISVRIGCNCVVATSEQRRKRGKHHKKNKG